MAAIMLIALVAGCGGSGESARDDDGKASSPVASQQLEVPEPAYDRSDDPWSIVVSLPIFADFAREMGGDQVSVTVLIPPGSDPHTYVPPPEAADAIKSADMVFVNGLGLDDPTIDFIQANRPDGRLFMVDFVRNIPSPSTQQPIGGMPIFAKEVGDNPHLYLDPVLVPIYAETISHSLVIVDELNEPYYDALFANYKSRLEALQEEIAAEMAALPAESRSIVTEHDSMIHWANRYGLQVAATLERDGEAAVRAAVGGGSPAILPEVGFGDGTLQDIADASQSQACEISTDTIADEDTSYIEMMRANASAITRCLDG
jgi:ABC-type Zn uptake system ZnuABC Zn-binding protein ZnuA